MKIFIISLSFIWVPSFSMAYEMNEFEVFFIPLYINFYMPPSREDIMKYGNHLVMISHNLSLLYKLVNNLKGVKPLPEDYTRLRVMLVNNQDQNELFVTTDKALLSLSKDKRYQIDINLVDEIIKELNKP